MVAELRMAGIDRYDLLNRKTALSAMAGLDDHLVHDVGWSLFAWRRNSI